MKQGRLGYNSGTERYGLLISDLWVDEGFHCGDSLEIFHEGEWVGTTIENCKGRWYLTKLPNITLENAIIRVQE